MIKIILDTSFLVKCAEYGIDLFSEIRRVVDSNYSLHFIDRTVNELDKLIDGRTMLKHHAKLAKKFLTQAKSIQTKKDLIVDDLILEYAESHNGMVVATHDSGLKRRLKDSSVSVIIIRQKKYLKFVEC